MRNRVVKLLITAGYLRQDEEPNSDLPDPFASDQPTLAACMSASVQNRIALGENAGQRVRRVGSFGSELEEPIPQGPRCASVAGFSLHANVRITTKKELERLCRYVARNSVATERLFWTPGGKVGYKLKRPWSDGTQIILFTPLEFIEKLVSLIPRPRAHIVRYHGCLAPNSAIRKKVVPEVPSEKADATQPNPKTAKRKRYSWAELLRRVFNVEVTLCPNCGGALKVIAAILNREVIRSILTHLGLPADPPTLAPARAPPQTAFDFA